MADNKPDSMKIDSALVRELAQLLADTDLTEIEVELENLKNESERLEFRYSKMTKA